MYSSAVRWKKEPAEHACVIESPYMCELGRSLTTGGVLAYKEERSVLISRQSHVGRTILSPQRPVVLTQRTQTQSKGEEETKNVSKRMRTGPVD